MNSRYSHLHYMTSLGFIKHQMSPNDTIFISFFATSTNSAARPDAEQDDHVDSVRVLPRLKLTILILLHRRQREKVARIHISSLL